jgi:hypothetical protein
MRAIVPAAPRVIHALPGRLRVHLPGWAGQEPELEQQLRQMQGVRRVRANRFTANVLILYDPNETDASALVAAIPATWFSNCSRYTRAQGDYIAVKRDCFAGQRLTSISRTIPSLPSNSPGQASWLAKFLGFGFHLVAGNRLGLLVSSLEAILLVSRYLSVWQEA